MSYMYNDLLLNTTTLLATHRDKRPIIKDSHQGCPFCKENEAMLERIWIKEYVNDDTIRIVDNKYPVCSDTLKGIHDVIIETHKHDLKINQLTHKQWEVLVNVITERWQFILAHYPVKWIQLFKNNGYRAGASIEHPHWQLIALEMVPLPMKNHYNQVHEQFKTKGCQLCKGKIEGYTVLEKKHWYVVAPFMARFDYETWVIPKRHCSQWTELSKDEQKELAWLMQKMTGMYEKLLPSVDYNICVMSGAVDEDQSYHLTIKFIPRIGYLGGFELASQCYINTVAPTEYGAMMSYNLAEELKGETDGTTKR